MKRSIISSILLISLIIILCQPVWATNYYVRPSGGSYGSEDGTSYANAWDGFSNINWSTVDSGNGKLFVCGTHRETLTIQASGEDGTPIYVANCTTANGASTDDPGYILMSEAYDHTDWGSPWYDVGGAVGNDNDGNCNSDEKCIYRFKNTSFENKWVWSVNRSTDGGTTWARVKHVAYDKPGTWSTATIISSLDDEEFYFNANNDAGWWWWWGGRYAYFRCDYATCGAGGANLGTWEIPIRELGVNLMVNTWVTVDGLTLRFGGMSINQGSPRAHAVRFGNDNHVFQNMTIEYNWWWGFLCHSGANVDNITFQNNIIRDSVAGIAINGDYTPHDHSSLEKTNITVTGNSFLNIARVKWDSLGDTEALGIQGADGVTITENIFDHHLYSEPRHNTGKNFVAIVWSKDVKISRNYFYRCGLTCMT